MPVLKGKELIELLRTSELALSEWVSENPDGLIDFKGFVFDESFNQRLEKIVFSDLNFSEAVFSQGIRFCNCTFKNPISFYNVKFENGGVTFIDDCVFYDEVKIRYVSGANPASGVNGPLFLFSSVRFHKNIDIEFIENMDVRFNCVDVAGNITITDSKRIGNFRIFESKVSGGFKAVGRNTPISFLDAVDFVETEFDGSVEFSNACFEGPLICPSIIGGRLKLGNCTFKNKIFSPYFVRSIIKGGVDLSYSNFSKVPDFRLSEVAGPVIFYETSIRKPKNVLPEIALKTSSPRGRIGFDDIPNIIEELDYKHEYARYAKLKVLAGESKNDDYEKLFFIEELRLKREGEHKNILWFFNWFYEHVGGSGFYSHRPLLVIFFTWVVFACIFQMSASDEIQLGSFDGERWRNSFLFSASNLVPFLAGAGDMYEESKSILFSVSGDNQFSSFLYGVTLVENFFGVVLVFLFGLTLRNRFKI